VEVYDDTDPIMHSLTTPECPTQKVVVFSDRAEVTRVVTIDAKVTGLHTIVITGFPTQVDKNTFRVAGSGSAKILEVSYSVVHPEDNPEHQKSLVRETEEKIKFLRRKLDSMGLSRNRLLEEEEYLKKYSLTFSGSNTVTAGNVQAKKFPSLADAANFLKVYRERLLEIKSEILELQTNQTELEKELNQMETIHKSKPKPTSERREVTIEIRVFEECQVNLDLSYIIKGSHWTSSYDVRVDTEQENLTLIYYASIINSTEEDWKDVGITLSTAEPAVGGFPPPIYPILAQFQPATHPSFVNSYDEDNYSSSSEGEEEEDQEREAASSMRAKRSKGKKKEEAKSDSVSSPRSERRRVKEQTTEVEETATGSAYQIVRKSTIDSDGKPHKVTITHLQLNVTFQYVCPPTKVSNCYLRAIATNNSTLNLLKGPMNVFMNNYFIAKSELAATNPKEEFKLYLGVDQGVKIDFQPIVRTESTSNTFIKKVKSETVTHTTKIKNLKTKPITIILFDQKPFSNSADIKIKIEEPKSIGEHVTVDEFSIISWNITLEPEQEQTVSYKYSIEYPQERSIEETEQNVQHPGQLRL